jgi:hypothetical protein
MNKFSSALLFLVVICINACDNNDKKINGSQEVSKTLVDSLEAEVMDGHNVGMAKYGKLTAMQNEAQRYLDSIATLPEKAQAAAAPLKSKLEGLINDLQSAKTGMDKWMEEYNMDSAVNNLEQRIKYLSEEKLKVSKVKESILNGLQKADSLLKAKL